MQMQIRPLSGDPFDEAQVAVRSCVGRERALHADLGGTEVDRFDDEVLETVSEGGDRRGVEVAVDHKGETPPVGHLGAHGVGEIAQVVELGLGGTEERDRIRVIERRRVLTCPPQRISDIVDRGADVRSPRTQHHAQHPR